LREVALPDHIVFDWDPVKAAANLAKHGVTFELAMRVFDDPLALSVLDRAAPAGEERWVTIGASVPAGLILVVHTHVELDQGAALIRIISARRPTRNEQRQYENEPG
jgi:uncharacterized DUF497 family protein